MPCGVQGKVEEAEVCEMIRRWRFGREHIGDTSLLKSKGVWKAMLDIGMPMTALLRNLGRLSALGMFDGGYEHGRQLAAAVAERFTNERNLKVSNGLSLNYKLSF